MGRIRCTGRDTGGERCAIRISDVDPIAHVMYILFIGRQGGRETISILGAVNRVH